MSAIIGTAGWSIPARDRAAFPEEGTALERYARVFGGVEVNSSFHRPHRPSTWARWAESVPDAFRFSVKMPKTVTHQAKLVDAGELVARFMDEVRPLGGKLAVVLVQLPPKLVFAAEVAERFFAGLRGLTDAVIACEPRHASWFDAEVDFLLRRLEVARIGADPALSPEAAVPGGWPGLRYFRLHGSPVIYRSGYDDAALDFYAAQLAGDAPSWCMFDNTASSEATGSALALMARLAAR